MSNLQALLIYKGFDCELTSDKYAASGLARNTLVVLRSKDREFEVLF